MRTLLVSTQFDGFLRIVLRYDSYKKEYVTHFYNEQQKGFSHGHYFRDSGIDALNDFDSRCTDNSRLSGQFINLDARETLFWQEQDLQLLVNRALAEQHGESTAERASQFEEHAEPHHIAFMPYTESQVAEVKGAMNNA